MINDWYKSYQDKVNSALKEYFDARYTQIASPRENEFQEALRYAVEWEGKRIRPILAMIMYEEVMWLPGDAILPYLIGLEFIHAYSLVHDDLPAMDNDEFRRGKLTVWKKYGESTGILVWDALQSMGIECMALSGDANVIHELAGAIGDMGMVRGQVRDVLDDHMKMEQKDIIRLHDEKTGRLISSSLLVWALLGGMQDKTTLDRFRWFWVLLGRAFQVRDDILDYEGNEALVGKLVGKDVAKGKGIVAFMGIEKAKTLLAELEYALLDIASSFQTAKFSDIVEYITRREK